MLNESTSSLAWPLLRLGVRCRSFQCFGSSVRPTNALETRGDQWRYELKFDGFRGVAVKDGESVRLFSRNGRDLSRRFARIVEAVGKPLAELCDKLLKQNQVPCAFERVSIKRAGDT